MGSVCSREPSMNPGERGSSLEGPLVGTKLLLGAQSRGRSGPQPGEQQVLWDPLAAPCRSLFMAPGPLCSIRLSPTPAF